MQENKQIEAGNLKIISDQLSHEALMVKKCCDYENKTNDQAIKSLCKEAHDLHKNNFTALKTYLDSHN